MKLYALHDKKAKSFASFHVIRTDAEASRNFADAVLSEGSVFGKYPEDFELVSLCEVHDAYESWPEAIPVSDIVCVVIVTASAVVAMRRPSQLELLKEA